MLILLTNNLAPVTQKISAEEQSLTENKVEPQGTRNREHPTYATS